MIVTLLIGLFVGALVTFMAFALLVANGDDDTDALATAEAERDAARIREEETARANGARIIEIETKLAAANERAGVAEAARFRETEGRASTVRLLQEQHRDEMAARKQAADGAAADGEDVDEWTAERLRRRGWAVERT